MSTFWVKTGTIAADTRLSQVHKNCNFFQLFWRKSLKIEEISTFWVKFRQIMGHMRDPQDAQKLQFFSEFGAQIAQNRRN